MKHYRILVKPYVLWSFLLIVLPLVLIVLYSVTCLLYTSTMSGTGMSGNDKE